MIVRLSSFNTLQTEKGGVWGDARCTGNARMDNSRKYRTLFLLCISCMPGAAVLFDESASDSLFDSKCSYYTCDCESFVL